jgi:hypothetical protein
METIASTLEEAVERALHESGKDSDLLYQQLINYDLQTLRVWSCWRTLLMKLCLRPSLAHISAAVRLQFEVSQQECT